MFSRPLWTVGFRPFFLLAGAFAALWIPLWLVMFWGQLPLNDYLRGYDWHKHEMLFGFVAAAIAGFLLTAVRNWTRRPTASGGWLALLVLLWLVGRAVVWLAGSLPWQLVMAADVAFLPVLALVILKPIWGARNWRNIGFVPLLLALAGANVLMHGKAAGLDMPLHGEVGATLAVDLVVIFLVAVGGRIVPAFTKSALPDAGVQRIALADQIVVPVMLTLTALDAFETAKTAAAIAALIAGLTNAARMWRWRTRATLGKPILWALHLAYAWIAVGLLLKGIAGLTPLLSRSAATHALTVGAIGTFIMAMMSRVALGHTGRPLKVVSWIVAAYGLVTIAALIRTVITALSVDWYAHSVTVAALAWALAFVIFAIVYTPIVLGPRADAKTDA
jgi:uncharacterized protein involved in response to NO